MEESPAAMDDAAEAQYRRETYADFEALVSHCLADLEDAIVLPEEAMSDLSDLTESEDEQRRKKAKQLGVKGLDTWRWLCTACPALCSTHPFQFVRSSTDFQKGS
jgi:hypothetical protein